MIPLLVAIHVTIIVLWIGGVSFVTIVMFPMLLQMGDSLEQALMFQRIESVFARQARYYAWTAGITGFLLLYLMGMHTLLFTRHTVGISIMVVAWAFYVVVLTFEKRIFKIIFSDPGKYDTARTFVLLARFHWIVLGVSLCAVFFGVWAGHGGSF